MIDPRAAKFDWGQTVKTVDDLFNDGSFPQADAEALLAPRGTQGEVVNVGMHEATNTPVYLVEFPGGVVVGCLEEEIEWV